ncbi:MAG TPA: DUF4956 domain-containing protein [Prolixibacteraceae bacterium]|nr:DUF4956 domain-containing protein [Prolixibacteraceae bacterium]
MDKWSLFQKFLLTENSQISIWDFVANAVIVLILSALLELTYAKCAKSLSGRKIFAANFFLIGFTTMLIISIVKSSLALSLGLVGALSIVRFRSAIKEPEELAYLFYTIAIGLGLGANQRVITMVAFVILMLIIWGRYFMLKKGTKQQNLFLTVIGSGETKPTLTQIEDSIASAFGSSRLSRYDETGESIETSYWVEIKKPTDLENFKSNINKVAPGTHVSFVDNKSF